MVVTVLLAPTRLIGESFSRSVPFASLEVASLSLYLRGGEGVPWREGECYVTLLILLERYDVMLLWSSLAQT